MRSLSRAAALLVGSLVAITLVPSCADLPEIERDVCGNGVIDRERGEECDGLVPPELEQACRAERGLPVDGIDPCAASCAAAGDDAACQFVADGATTFCPVGYALGHDGVCRRPSGKFSGTALARVPGFGLAGAITDFDGDGFSDLLVTQGPQLTRVTYFKEDGVVFTEVPIPAVGAAAGFVSDEYATDPAADLLIANGPAITTYRGAEGPSMVPKAYAPFPNPFTASVLFAYPVAPSAAGALNAKAGFDLPLAAHVVGSELVFDQVNVSDLSLGPGQARFPLSPEQIKGRVVMADVLLDGNAMVSPLREPEIVIATASAVWMDSLSRTGDAAISMAAPAGESIVALYPVLGADSLAAVVVRTPGGELGIRVLVGEDTTNPPGFGPLERLPDKPFTGDAPAAILALGHVNADQQLDVVSDRGIFFNLPLGPAAVHFDDEPFQSGTEPWVSATIADIHGDGKNEVIALPKSGNLAVLLPGTPFTMNPAIIQVPKPPSHVDVSDFDGDGVGDIMVLTETGTEGPLGAEGCDDSDDLYLLFGNTAGLPADPVLLGSLRGIWNAAPMRLFVDGITDGIADIGVQSSCSPNGDAGDYVGVFFGSTSRIVSSPFSPYADEFAREATIERVATGHLTGPDATAPLDGHHDVAIVATLLARDEATGAFTGWDREVRLLPVVGDAEMVDIEEALPLSKAADDEPLRAHEPGLAVGPLFSGSAADEVIVLSATLGAPEVTFAITVVERASSPPARQDYPLGITSSATSTVGRVRLVDFDGDGDLDVLALVRAGLSVSARLLVNDGAALLPAVEPTPILFQAYDLAALTPPTCTSFEPGCDPTRGMLMGGFGQIAVCRWGDFAECEVAIKNDLLNGTLVVGDVNGDGLEDIVTMTPVGTEIFTQCSQSDLAQGACAAAPVAPPPQ